MDATDVRILRALTWNPHDPSDARRGIQGVWDIARELGVHGNTVKRRLADMEALGVLEGLHMWPELGIIGTDNALFAFTFPDAETKQAAYDALEHDDVCSDLYSFVGTEAWFGINAPDGDDVANVAQAIATRCGATGIRFLDRRRWSAQPVTDLERRILSEFHADALVPLTHVADRVGVSAKTVKAKVASLAEKQAFIIFPYIYPARVDGLIPVMIEAEPEPGAHAAPSLLDTFPDAIIRCLPGSTTPYVALALPSTRHVAEAVRRAASVPGVRTARHHLIEDSRPCRFHHNQLRLSDYVDAAPPIAA